MTRVFRIVFASNGPLPSRGNNLHARRRAMGPPRGPYQAERAGACVSVDANTRYTDVRPTFSIHSYTDDIK